MRLFAIVLRPSKELLSVSILSWEEKARGGGSEECPELYTPTAYQLDFFAW